MRQPATRELFDYWNHLRGNRAAPERSDIDLVAIRGMLADIFMLDVDPSHYFPFVLSGTRINALFCGEQKGQSFLDLWPPQEVHNIAAVLLTVVDAACPVVAAVQARPDGYREADIEILLLPFHHHGHAQARIMGLMAAAAQPSWLGLLPAQYFILRSIRAIDSGAPRRDAIGPAFVSLLPNKLPRRRISPEIRGHLRVFKGGK